jgi:hypothetical protein
VGKILWILYEFVIVVGDFLPPGGDPALAGEGVNLLLINPIFVIPFDQPMYKRISFRITSLILCFLALTSLRLSSQSIPHSVSNTGIYEFLDELAGEQVISINSAVKPYSRLLIAQCLTEADGKREMLNGRQQKELDFYLMDFRKESGKEWNDGTKVQRYNGETTGQWLNGIKGVKRLDLFYYKDSLFTITVNPILGGEIFSNSAGNATYWRNGAVIEGYIGKWGFYASLRDNHEKPLLGLPAYLTQREGGHIKGGTDWSEMQGGITYSWKWGNIGLVKDRIRWGNNYNGANIFGGHVPSYVMLKLQVTPARWLDFNYFHGWLNSRVVDTARSYWVVNSYGTDYREVYHKKFIAANLLTVTPFSNFRISAGNSIVYSDLDFYPGYLLPILFYKSVDHSVTSGINNMNSQMFLDVSSRQIRHLHLYGSIFVDELAVSRISKKDEWNFLSYKAGFRLSNYPFPNLSLTGELTYTYPLAFQHNVTTLTFENNLYNMGHYLKDNTREWYLALDYRPARTLNITLFFTDAIRGPDHTSLGGSRVGNPPLATVEWRSRMTGLRASYQVINDLYIWFSFIGSDITGEEDWSPGYFYGKKKTLNTGVSFGF